MTPFAQPYCAPDGTTRRSLVIRVPECDIGDLGDECISLADKHSPHRDRIAQALWRVAVEDWLMRQPVPPANPKGYRLMNAERAETRWLLVGLVLDHVPGFYVHDDTEDVYHEGGSIAEVLNAAAHAVADQMGVEP